MKLTISHVTKSYGSQNVLDGASLTVKVICGLEPADSGSRVLASETKVGYLSQITFLDQEITVHEELLKAFDKVRQLEKDLKAQAKILESDASQAQLDKYDRMKSN